jgi:hypothetical protein
MAFKLINPQGIVHDFAHKMSWGHNIEGSDEPGIVEFDDLKTQKFQWSVFHYFPIRKGDFIIRNMNSGRIGIYEVQSSEKDRCGSPFGPDDLYECVVYFCGYYDKNDNRMNIFNGYGIKKTLLDEILRR